MPSINAIGRYLKASVRMAQAAHLVLLEAHKLSGVVARDLSGLHSPSNGEGHNETDTATTGGPEEAK